MYDAYTKHIAPQLYDAAYDQLARPYGLMVEQAINRLLAERLNPDYDPGLDKLPRREPMGEKGRRT